MSADSISPRPTEADVGIPYRRSGLVLPLVVIAGGAVFAVVLVSAASDTTARVVLAFVAVLTLALGGYSLFWMIRGLLSDPGPLVIGQDGLALTLQGQLYVPWSEVVACRMDRHGSVLVDLASPISHVAESGWMRRLARGRTLVISNRFLMCRANGLTG